MIEDPPLLTIRRRFPRPAPAEVDAFSGLPTGFVVDALGGSGALAAAVKPIGAIPTLCGVALTCDPGPGDNLALFGAIGVAAPGDIVVAARHGFLGNAVTGDLVLGMMKNRGIAGFVTDGAVRDVAGIRDVGLPCFAAAVSPNSPSRAGPGSVGLPVVVGGVAVASGDIIIGDADGVVVVPQARIAAAIARLPSVRAAEAALDRKVRDGLTIPDFVQALIDAGRFHEID
jgi:4-hydroxy-4-methyl-2-oxoglutarate aldolase